MAERRLLERYLDALYAWNARLNLTAVPREGAWDRHVGEALGLLDAAPIAEGSRVVDVGSGAGLPGIPLAVVRPDLELTLCESDRRRAGFLTHVAGLLGLRGVHVDEPQRVGEGWDEVLRADRPAVLEVEVDPEIPPLPPHIKMEQAKKMAKAALHGDPELVGIATKTFAGKVREFIPGQ